MTIAPLQVGDPPAIGDAFAAAGEIFEAVVNRVPAATWDDPSPCAGWTVRDVVSHVVETLDKAAAIAHGVGFDRDPTQAGDAAGDDPPASVRAAAGRAREAVRAADPDQPADGPQGTSTVATALAFPTADLVVHAWDVAHATGQTLRLPADLLAHVVHTCTRVTEQQLRGSGLFGPALTVSDDADDTTRLMAWLGRDTRPATETP